MTLRRYLATSGWTTVGGSTPIAALEALAEALEARRAAQE